MSSGNAAMFSPSDLKIIEEFIEINEQAKILDTKKKDLSAKVKSLMDGVKIDSLNYNGSSLQITDSTRYTVNKNTKDIFIAQLNTMGKGSLLTIEIGINKESLEAEMASGSIDANFVRKFVSIVPVKTLRCS